MNCTQYVNILFRDELSNLYGLEEKPMLTLLSNLSKLASGIMMFIKAILILTDTIAEDDTKLDDANAAVTEFIGVLEGLDFGDAQ